MSVKWKQTFLAISALWNQSAQTEHIQKQVCSSDVYYSIIKRNMFNEMLFKNKQAKNDIPIKMLSMLPWLLSWAPPF